MSTPRIGVVGLGDIATKAYLPVLAGRGDLERTLMSQDPGRVARASERFAVPRRRPGSRTSATPGWTRCSCTPPPRRTPTSWSGCSGRGCTCWSTSRSLVVGFNRRHAPVYAAPAALPRSIVLARARAARLLRLCGWFLPAVGEDRIRSARDALRPHEICEQVVRPAETCG